MIQKFKCQETEKIWLGIRSSKLPENIQHIARRKLRILNAARSLNDLRIPPGNMLKGLSGNKSGWYSIRINDQWRICFIWDREPTEVQIIDYH